MTKRKSLVVAAVLITAILTIVPAMAQGHVKARIGGYQEVPPISSQGHGSFTASIDHQSGIVEYELSYEGLESPVLQAHIHFGQAGVNGGVIAVLCDDGSSGAPICPENGEPVSGMIDANSIIGPVDQGILEGDFRAAIVAVLSGVTYVNVHTEAFPSGEIRGQIRRGFGGGSDRRISDDEGDGTESESPNSSRNRGKDENRGNGNGNGNGNGKGKDKDKGGD